MDPLDLTSQFLIRIYDHSDGKENFPVETASFSLAHGLTFQQVDEIVEGLVRDGFLLVHTPTHVKLTRKGVLEVERLLQPPMVEAAPEPAPFLEPEPAPKRAARAGKARVVFLTHQGDHQELAQVIKQNLEAAFGNQLRVFLSSELYAAPGSAQSKEKILKVVRSLSIHFLLCNEKTLEIPWVNIEIGASWLQGKPIIPICFGELIQGTLPKPYDELPALDLDDNFASKLLMTLEERLGAQTRAEFLPESFREGLRLALNTL